VYFSYVCDKFELKNEDLPQIREKIVKNENLPQIREKIVKNEDLPQTRQNYF
jgi:hypothetical protein